MFENLTRKHFLDVQAEDNPKVSKTNDNFQLTSTFHGSCSIWPPASGMTIKNRTSQTIVAINTSEKNAITILIGHFFTSVNAAIFWQLWLIARFY